MRGEVGNDIPARGKLGKGFEAEDDMAFQLLSITRIVSRRRSRVGSFNLKHWAAQDIVLYIGTEQGTYRFLSRRELQALGL